MSDSMFKLPQPVPAVEVDLVSGEDAVVAETSERHDLSVAAVAGTEDLPCPPPGTFVLETLKNGTVVDSQNVTKPIIRFGRARDCEMPMDHPSISRYHAVLTWKPGPSKSGTFFLKDLDSTHGSFVNKKRMPAGLVARIEPNNSVIKLGGSTRSFLLNAIVELDDGVETGENNETAADDREAEIEVETDPEILYEQFLALVLNPSTGATKNEHVFSENPHRVLQQWFDREGLEFEYDVTQHGTKFRCSVQIPVEGRDVKIEGTDLQARKKDAIDHVCLVACRVLDQTMRLYPWQNSRKTKKRTVKSDDEDDDVLDETVEARNKRSRKSEGTRQGADHAAETFETLMDKWNDCNQELASCKASLVSLAQEKSQPVHSPNDEDADSLDSYMHAISETQCTRDIKIKQSQIKIKIKDLEKKQRVYELLMKAAKPISLPPQEKEIAAVDAPDESSVPEKLSEEQDKKGESNSENVKVTIKPITPASLLTSKAAALFSQELEVDEAEAAKTNTSKESATESPNKFKIAGPMSAEQSAASGEKSKAKRMAKGKKEKERKYDDDFVDWCPPAGQDGSGKTRLNDKLGY